MQRSPCVVGLACALLLALAPVASAKPTKPVQGPEGPAFYAPPKQANPVKHGTLIRYRATSVSVGATAETKAWNLIYRSRGAQDAPDAVAGTAFVPSAPWDGPGARPIVSFAVGTQGLGESCAPSRQFDAGTEYENANISAALNQGWAVLVTDYEGYLDGQTPTYSAGRSQGHAVLDIVRAARKLPGAGLSRKAEVALWGYSQGGQSAAWAGEQESSYTPEADVQGVVAGGVPADLLAVAHGLDGNVGEGLLLAANIGIDQAYPKEFKLDSHLNDAGRAASEAIKAQCVGETLASYAGHSLSEYSKGNQTLDQLAARKGIKKVFRLNKLGLGKPKVPVLQFHSLNDDIVPLGQAVDLRDTYCHKGVTEQFTTYPGNHVTGAFTGSQAAVDWIAARFAGDPAPDNCDETITQPPG
jgi:secretory lipase